MIWNMQIYCITNNIDIYLKKFVDILNNFNPQNHTYRNMATLEDLIQQDSKRVHK